MQKILRVVIVLFAALLPLAPARPAVARNVPAQPATSIDVPPPVLLKDIYTADASSDPWGFFDAGDKFYFVNADPAHGSEPWVSDGTADGTRILKDIVPGAGGSGPYGFTLFRGKVFFTARYSQYESSSGVWTTDGTPAGTVVIYGAGYSSIYYLAVLGDWLYFALSGGRLMRYGGPGNVTEQLSPPGFSAYTSYLTVMDGALYLVGTEEAAGVELWRYDPDGQLALVKDICPGICLSYEDAGAGSYPNNLTVVGDTLYFTAIDADHGFELWASDGSAAGTRLVKDITPGQASADVSDLTAAGSWLYFTANDGTHGLELWRSDGTPENTGLVADLAPGALSAFQLYQNHELVVMGAGDSLRVFFSARDAAAGEGHGLEMWSAAVTQAGVPAAPVLLEIAPGANSGQPESLRVLGSTLYFAAQDTPGDIELWKSGGSPYSTARVADLVPGPDGSAPMYLSTWNGRLVFSAVDPLNGREPWISDGTSPGTTLIGNMAYTIYAEGSSPSAGLLTQVGGRNIRYFTARDVLHGRELWRTDGTTAGTWLVKDTYPGPEDGMYSDAEMVEMNGILYFTPDHPDYGANLWRTDGTPEGTWLVKMITPADRYNDPHSFTPVGGQLFFIANDDIHGDELWVTDGSAAGTHLVKEVVPGAGGLQYTSLAALGNQLVFIVDTDEYTCSVQLWRSDGTPEGTQPFLGPYTFTNGCLNLLPSAAFQDRLYFSMPNPASPEDGEQLWFTDGTAAGTKRITPTGDDFYMGPHFLVRAGGYLYFIASSSESGWYTNFPTLWRMPLGATMASKLRAFYPYSRYLGLINPSTLIYLGNDSYYDEDFWVVIDAVSGETKSECSYGCYPPKISSYAPWLGSMYFAAGGSDTLPSGLWATDGTLAGTKNIAPADGLNFTSVDHILSAGNTLYFSADDDVHGSEPWIIRLEQDHRLYLPAVQKK